MSLATGDLAPDFTLPTNGGGSVTLSALRGRPVIVYFYPADDTPGCTIEANDFSRSKPLFDKLGVEIIGISPDSAESHDKFCRKYDLSIRLAADEGNRVASAYGSYGEKLTFGRRHTGVLRTTFLVDRQGRIAQIWPQVKVAGHAEEVLDACARL
ncbi:MAG: peroxiredoxin [Bauldia sp.]